MFFSNRHVWMWDLDYKENWVPKNWCFWTVVLDKIIKSLLGCKIKPVNPKGNQSWIFIGRTWCWSWNSNTLAIWCEDDSFEKILELRKTEGRRRSGWQRLWRSNGISDSMDISWANSRSFVMDREVCHTAVHGVAKSRTWVSDWTELNPKKLFLDVDCL